jgi:transposase
MYDREFRKAALRLYDYFGNMRQTAKALQIGVATIWRWVHTGIDQAVRIKKVQYTDAILSFLKTTIQNKNYLTQADLIVEIKANFGIVMSRQCVSQALSLIGVSRKRLRKRGFTKPYRLVEEMERFKKSYLRKPGNVVLSLDEIGFDQRMTPLYGYSAKGSKAICHTHPTIRKRVNAIVAIDNYGKSHHILIEGPVASDAFKEFIQQLPWPCGSTILMDNVSFHKTQCVRDVALLRGFNVIYTPPYSPDCNPIENIFSVLKNSYRKRVMELPNNLHDVVNACILALDHSTFSRCFLRMEKFIGLHNC